MELTKARRLIRRRRLAAELISLLPFNAWRCFAYRLLGYQITDSKIGWRTVIAIESLQIEGALIARRNKIVGPLRMTMKKNAAIGSGNLMWCDLWTLDQNHKKFNYQRELILEEASLLTNDHVVDVVDRIRIGAGTHVAGRGTQMWTHGHSGDQRDIDIGIDCFLGSSCIFTPGSGVGDRSIVGSGAVVAKRYTQKFVMIAGNPSAILREDYYWRTRDGVVADSPPPLPKAIEHVDSQ